ncbi:HNH endonuclease signature motif containing protein [Roseovarius sp. THAF27]|uniref:HNH endonuclease signature motif containing protein n=1 Tax=Roseovarius sp. THAF27 TaxID=2587850 RepID=UPI001561C36A
MAGDVDHVVPRSAINACGIGVFDPSNCQYLCQSCHSTKTNAERNAGREKRARVPRRTALKGRGAFLDAAGITPQIEQEETPC